MFHWCRDTNLPMIAPPVSPVDSFRFDTIGHDDEIADTMFALYVNDERVITQRPEQMLVNFVDDIIKHGALMILDGTEKVRREVDDDRIQHLIGVNERLNNADWPYDL